MRGPLVIALLLVSWLTSAPAGAQDRVALVIGNAGYRHAPRLNNPLNDARDIAAALRRAPLGFDVMVVEDRDLGQMLAVLRDFSNKARRASIALFFYAGHAMQAASPDRKGQTNYLLPIDTRARREADLSGEAVTLEMVINAMEGARTTLVILDACRDNPLAEAMARFDGGRGGGTRGLTPISIAQPNQLVAYSTRPGMVAADGTGRNSPFTQYLLRHMASPGLEVRAMLQNVRRDVWEATRSQFPMNEDLLVEPVYLVPAVSVAPPQVTDAVPQTNLTPPSQTAAPVHSCDQLAQPRAGTLHGGAPVLGVFLEGIDGPAALAACQAAVTAYPGEPRFIAWLGRAHERLQQFDLAFAAYQRAAAQGYAPGQNNLGTMHQHGRGGLVHNDTEAVRLYRLAADQGYSVAQTNLGFMHAQGRGGLPRNDVEAVHQFKLAADQGYSIAQNTLGFMHVQGRGGLARSDVEAVRLYKLAADQGYAKAQANLGWMHREGRGGLALNNAEAIRLFKLAAGQGDADGQYALGSMYEYGHGGLARNVDEAVRLYKLVADQGYAYAQNKLGLMFARGEGGVPRDLSEALRLFTLSADQNDMEGQFYLAMLNLEGLDV